MPLMTSALTKYLVGNIQTAHRLDFIVIVIHHLNFLFCDFSLFNSQRTGMVCASLPKHVCFTTWQPFFSVLFVLFELLKQLQRYHVVSDVLLSSVKWTCVFIFLLPCFLPLLLLITHCSTRLRIDSLPIICTFEWKLPTCYWAPPPFFSCMYAFYHTLLESRLLSASSFPVSESH